MNKRLLIMLAAAGLVGLSLQAAEKKAAKEKKIKQSFDLRLINFTADEFYRVKVSDSGKKVKDLYDGRINDQSYIMLKRINRKNLPLNVSVWESADETEPTELTIEDVKREDIKVEPKDLWVLYRDDAGDLQITEANPQPKAE